MYRIVQKVKHLPRRRILFPESWDNRVLRAAARVQKDFADVVLLSPNLRNVPDILRNGLCNVPVIVQRDNLLDFGHKMLVDGKVDGMISGATFSSKNVLKSAIKHLSQRGLTVSSFFLMDFKNRTPLLFADCAVIPQPNSMQLRDIGIGVSHMARKMFGMDPRVAFLSFSTKNSAEHECTYKIQRAVLATRMADPTLIVDGEFQADTALVPKVAQSKAMYSKVKGNANVLVFPSLESGNIAYKLVQTLSGCSAVGPILVGLDKPSNDLSRACSEDDIYNLAAITCLQSTI